jgi:multidrug efflux pump subunit AcrA (membrane-fusion protein)
LLLGGGVAAAVWHDPTLIEKARTLVEAKAPAPKAPPLRVVPVTAVEAALGDMELFLNGLGTVVASSTVTVRSRVEGELLEVTFAEGQPVEAGDLLARIDPRAYEVSLRQAEAQLARDEAVLRAAEFDLERAESLAELRNVTALAKANPLADAITEDIRGGLLKQTVVFGWHVKALDAILERLCDANISAALLTGATTPKQRERIQTDFANGFIQVVVANIVTAGTAIDLSAAEHGYFLELDWVPSNNAQASNRIVSLMKNRKVSFDIATIPGSVDELIQRALRKKTQELRQLF